MESFSISLKEPEQGDATGSGGRLYPFTVSRAVCTLLTSHIAGVFLSISFYLPFEASRACLTSRDEHRNFQTDARDEAHSGLSLIANIEPLFDT